MLSHNYAGCSLGIRDWRILCLLEQNSPADVRCDVFHSSDIHNVVLRQLSPAILEFLMMTCISWKPCIWDQPLLESLKTGWFSICWCCCFFRKVIWKMIQCSFIQNVVNINCNPLFYQHYRILNLTNQPLTSSLLTFFDKCHLLPMESISFLFTGSEGYLIYLLVLKH